MTSDNRATTVSIKTIGCRLNQAESAQIAAAFGGAGYTLVKTGSPADICVLHTCAVTGNAERKCMQFARSLKRRSPGTFVVLAGCAAETSGAALLGRSDADLVVGQKDKFRLPGLLAERGISPGTPDTPPPCPVPRFETTRALVKVQNGCDFNCAYCIVPRARGLPVSRPVTEILDEVRRLADAGFREVVLTGANLGCYRDGHTGLVQLLAAVERIEPLKRIRISSVEVSTVERDVLTYMRDSAKLCRYMHIPMQSGSDPVLRAMRRRYSAARYLALVDYAVQTVPDLGLGTDVIVGFPGEDEAAFEATHTIIERLPFSNLHVFPYSRRTGTAAADLPGQVPEQLKKLRVAELTALGDKKKSEFAARFIGRHVEVLIEGPVSNGTATGWTGEYVRAILPGAGLAPNDLVQFIPRTERDGILT